MSVDELVSRIASAKERLLSISLERRQLFNSNEQFFASRNIGDIWECSLRRNLEDKFEKLGEYTELVTGELEEFGNGLIEPIKEDVESIIEAVSDPWGAVQDTASGIVATVTNPKQAAVDAWEDFSDPYVEDWTNGREAEAIGRGTSELGQMAIPGYGVVRVGGRVLDTLRGLSRRTDGDGRGPDRGDSSNNNDSSSNNDSDSQNIQSSDNEGDSLSETPPTTIAPSESDHGDGSSSNTESSSNEGDASNVVDRDISQGSVEDLLDGATIRNERPSRMRIRQQYDLSGGFGQANLDFDQLTAGRQVNIDPDNPQIRTATLEDGRNVVVRPGSSRGNQDPTIQIDPPRNDRNSQPTIKIRYGDERFENGQ